MDVFVVSQNNGLGHQPDGPTKLSPTEEPITCVRLLYPENAVEVPAVGKVTFEWTAHEGAETYLLTFTLPSGETVDFETNGTTRDRYMEAFAQAGEYQWNVTALASDGSQIFSNEFFTFTKPQKPGGGSGSDGSGGGGGSCPDGSIPDPVIGCGHD